MSKKDWDEEIERLRCKSTLDKSPVRVPESVWQNMLLSHKDTMIVGGTVHKIVGRKIGPRVWELTLEDLAKAKKVRE